MVDFQERGEGDGLGMGGLGGGWGVERARGVWVGVG